MTVNRVHENFNIFVSYDRGRIIRAKKTNTCTDMEYMQLIKQMDERLVPDGSFDVIRREINIGTKKGIYYAIDGMSDSAVLERVIDYLVENGDPASLSQSVPYLEIKKAKDADEAVLAVLSGVFALMCEGFDGILLVFAKKFPSRSIQETENEKSLRGPRDSFTEQIITNTALIRRRVRDPALRVERFTLGKMTKTDVALLYIDGKASRRLLSVLRRKLTDYTAPTMSFGEQTLAEYLVRTRWYDPFPKVRYTERPDSASAMLLEGSVILVCDNTPAVMILPTSIFDFLHESNDFYLPPITATYLRLVRLLIAIVTVTLMPTWYMLIKNQNLMPSWLSVLRLHENEYAVPILLQIVLVELIIDGLKIASLNTPNSLGNSLSVVTGLILGELAVDIGWFVPEVILYMAFVSIANFTQPSYELGYALKFVRMMILFSTALFNIWGYALGLAAVIGLILFNKTVDGSRSYLYPLIPWNGEAMKRFFFRVRLKDEKSIKQNEH